jgi:hypothetical protein
MKSKVQNPDSSERPIPHERKITVLTFVAWFCVILGFLAIVPGVCRLVSEPHADGGQISLASLSSFGSYLQGAVQSLWSLAAFLFIYVAFLGQKQQLQLQAQQFEIEQRQQKQQIEQQEIELENQRQQFRIQNDSIRLQNFENAFFQLLNQQSQIVGSMRAAHLAARACFEKWYKEELNNVFTNEWRKTTFVPNQRIVADEKQYAIKCYEKFYKEYQHELGHYFRNLYHIIKFVDETEVLKAENPNVEYQKRRRYTSLARAQLSVYELCLLFYNGLGSEGVKFLPLIKKYDLIENLHDRKTNLLSPAHENFYD